MVIQKLISCNKSEYVYDQIFKAIESGKYRIGDRLPPELELADMAGVSRASVREALSALRLAGVIETQKGNGTFVKASQGRRGRQKSIVHFDGSLNIFEVLEARKVVEPAVAKLVLEVINDKQLEKIQNAFHEMEAKAKDKNFDGYHQANKRFHSAIVDATKNRSLIDYVYSLQVVFIDSEFGAKLRRMYLTDEEYVREAIDIHHEIYEALADHDEKRLDQAWKRHNESLESQLLGK